MQLVINISEEAYNTIEKIKFLVGGRTNRKLQLEVINAIKNGKLLPQGHGDLIDRSKLELDYDWCEYEDGTIITGYSAYSQSQIELAPTVIEADKEN